jgi:hypothetical protein
MRLFVIALLLGFAAMIAGFTLTDQQEQIIYNFQQGDKWYPLQAICLLAIAYAVPIYLLLLLASWVLSPLA